MRWRRWWRSGEEGAVSYIGVAGGPVGLMARFVGTGAFDVVLTHNRYTLLDRSAESLIAKAAERGVGVVNAAVFGGGVLAKGVDQLPKYAYHEISPEARQRVKEMEALCSEHGVPLGAAALQFSLRDPRVESTVVGISLPERVDETAELASWPIPGVMWEKLEELALPADKWLY